MVDSFFLPTPAPPEERARIKANYEALIATANF